MKRNPILLSILLTALTVVGAGCSEPGAGPAPVRVDYQTWRRGVERYVADEGNGDPNILRDTTLPTSQPGFSLIGQASVPDSTDANGLLLAHRVIGGKPWFVFLVGLVKAGQLQDLRLAALSCEAGDFTWCIGSEEPRSLRQYLSTRVADSEENAEPVGFPGAEDQFDVAVSGDGHLTVTDRASSAVWELDIGPNASGPQHARRKSNGAIGGRCSCNAASLRRRGSDALQQGSHGM